MAYKKNTTNLTELLLQCVTQPDSMLSMLEWLCTELMEVGWTSSEDRGLSTPRLIISDAHAGLVSAIRESFPDASWQRCKLHFMRSILVYVPQKEKKS